MKKKVLHLSSALSWRGGERQVFYTHNGMETSDEWESVLACPKGSELSKRFKNSSSLKEYVLRKAFNPLLWWDLFLLAKKEAPSIIHAHDANAHTAIFWTSVFFRLKIPIVIHRRVLFPISTSFTTQLKYNHSLIKRIFCVSNAIGKALSKQIKNADRIRTIYSGLDLNSPLPSVDYNLRNHLKIPENAFVVLTTSSLSKEKGLDIFAKVALLLYNNEERPFHFILIGKDEGMGTWLNDFIETNKINDRFHCIGFHPQAATLISQADIFLFCSRSEGLGTSILDAFRAKVPVIASNTGGIPEMVIPGVTGILVDTEDIEGYVAAIKNIVSNGSLEESLKLNSQVLLESFDVHHLINRLKECYSEVLSDPT